MQQVRIEEFIALARQYPVVDVRSPAEYCHAHIPGAYSLPLFSDEERKVVGTIYKQQGREQAIKAGLDYFGVKMRKMVEEAEKITADHKSANSRPATPNCLLLHCWRGGMRSAGVSWLLDLYGFKVYTLEGGYKAFRNWVLRQLEQPFPFRVLGGYTGSGKTGVLKTMADAKHAIIDLEGIAHHKGSAFGALGETKQPGQEMFENILGTELHTIAGTLPPGEPIWIEDESRRIGSVNLPDAMWKTIQESPLYFLAVPFEARLDHISKEYGKFKKEELVSAVMRIQKRLGGLNTKNVVNYLLEDNCKESFRILLSYYDKYYERSLHERATTSAPIKMIACASVDGGVNFKKLTGEKY